MVRLLALVLALVALGVRADENDGLVTCIATPDEVVGRMLELAGTGRDDLVADLGSGDGRLVITAADAEGAGALSRVSTLDLLNLLNLPHTPQGKVDFARADCRVVLDPA